MHLFVRKKMYFKHAEYLTLRVLPVVSLFVACLVPQLQTSWSAPVTKCGSISKRMTPAAPSASRCPMKVRMLQTAWLSASGMRWLHFKMNCLRCPHHWHTRGIKRGRVMCVKSCLYVEYKYSVSFKWWQYGQDCSFSPSITISGTNSNRILHVWIQTFPNNWQKGARSRGTGENI